MICGWQLATRKGRCNACRLFLKRHRRDKESSRCSAAGSEHSTRRSTRGAGASPFDGRGLAHDAVELQTVRHALQVVLAGILERQA
jgi:hypothetical protein